MKIVLFHGFSGGGKTTALTSISRAIVKARLGKIGTIKRIHDRDFSIDSKGKDTWLHASSGSSVVVAVAPKEIDIIRREEDTSTISLREILGIFTRSKVDYLLVEGLHQKFENARNVKRIICAKNEAQAKDLMKIHHGNILFVTGKFANKSRGKEINGIPVFSLPRDGAKALHLIER
ncbi:MAG: molybdopterin-guanine dinucleotide biosynthesis protein MobB [Nitrososphaerales archaeon]|jgi:molybdopterin-guanine dinucleotide biosynthesis protein MobB